MVRILSGRQITQGSSTGDDDSARSEAYEVGDTTPQMQDNNEEVTASASALEQIQQRGLPQTLESFVPNSSHYSSPSSPSPSPSPSPNHEDFNLRIRGILAENAQLKDILLQNNVALKQQYQALDQWRIDVSNTLLLYQSKVEKARNIIDELKKENQELKNAKDAKKKEKKQDFAKNEAVIETKASAAAVAVTVPPPPPPHQSSNSAVEEAERRIADLSRRLQASEQKYKDEIARNTELRMAMEHELGTLRSENERLRATNEEIMTEKWEMSAANNELQNRLQQTMAMSYMQGSNAADSMLQEELGKMQIALSEERKVTEKLSHNLELEKRKVESLEQRAKGNHRRSQTSAMLPEEMRLRDEHLADSMEKFRLRCENLGSSLEECEEKLSGIEIQEEYHVDDLRKELASLRKLLAEERRRSSSDQQKLSEMNTLFGAVMRDYNAALDNLKEIQNEKKMKAQQQSVYEEIKESNYNTKIDTLTAKLLQTEEAVKEERNRIKELTEKLKRHELEAEAIPILKAQVEVYQADFNAEREAREKIAGEKADLEEELRRLRSLRRPGATPTNDLNVERILATETRPGTAPELRSRINRMAEQSFSGGSYRSLGTSPSKETFTCPKCSAVFTQLKDVENHVNECLDKGN